MVADPRIGKKGINLTLAIVLRTSTALSMTSTRSVYEKYDRTKKILDTVRQPRIPT